MSWSLKDAYGAVQTFVSDVSAGIHTAVHGVAPRTAGGLSIFRSLDVQPTGVVIKGSAGQLYVIRFTNQANATRYLKFYDKATAPASTDTPVLTFVALASQSHEVSITDIGAQFVSGIGVRATTGIADNDTGAPATNDVVLNAFYF